jgi:hypothetical protein
MPHTPLLELECECSANYPFINFLPLCAPKLIVLRFVFGFIYWYIWTILLPKWKNYSLEEKEEVLEDGTTVTTLIRVPNS